MDDLRHWRGDFDDIFEEDEVDAHPTAFSFHEVLEMADGDVRKRLGVLPMQHPITAAMQQGGYTAPEPVADQGDSGMRLTVTAEQYSRFLRELGPLAAYVDRVEAELRHLGGPYPVSDEAFEQALACALAQSLSRELYPALRRFVDHPALVGLDSSDTAEKQQVRCNRRVQHNSAVAFVRIRSSGGESESPRVRWLRCGAGMVWGASRWGAPLRRHVFTTAVLVRAVYVNVLTHAVVVKGKLTCATLLASS